MKTLLKNAKILKMDDTPLFEGNIVIQDENIIYIGNDYDKFGPFDQVHDCLGNVLMPGFKNAHTHNAMTFVSSKTDDLSLHDWLFNAIFPREALLKEDDVYHLSKVAFLEMLTSGITACFDQYYFPLSTGKAAEEIGFKVLLLGTYNTTYGHDGLVNLYKSLNTGDGLARYCFGIHAEYTTTDEEVESISRLTHELKAPFYVHISETESEVKECYERRGMSPVEYFASKGLFDYGGGGYHCIYFSDKDIEIFKKYHLNVVTCPGSNSKLASGIAPLYNYKEEGLNIAIGTDGPASNNCLDFFKEMTLVSGLQKLITKDPTAFPAYEVLKMATVNGAKAMGMDDADILEVGKKADIIEIDLNRPNMQPHNNVVNNIVYSGSKDNIRMTMINGKILYLDRKFYINQDVEEIYKNCQLVTDRIDSELKK